MTRVRINGPSLPAEIKEVEIAFPVQDLEDLISKLMECKPEARALLMAKGTVRSDLNILINGRHCMFLQGLKTKISSQDVVDIIMPMIGG